MESLNPPVDTTHEEPAGSPLKHAQSQGLLSPTVVMFLILATVACAGNLIVPFLFERMMPGNAPGITLPLVLGSLFVGLLLSEFGLIAYWANSNSIPLASRCIGVCMFDFLFGICLVIGCHAWGGMPIAFAITMIAVSSVFGFASWGLISLWDRLLGFQVVLTSTTSSIIDREIRERQFGIGTLLISMVLFAVGFVVIKQILPTNGQPWLPSFFDYVIIAVWFTWLFVAISVIVWVNRNAVLANASRSKWVGVLLSLVCVGPIVFQWLASLLLGTSLFKLGGPMGDSVSMLIAYCIAIGLTAGCSLTVSLMR
jgi:hypothetical protein